MMPDMKYDTFWTIGNVGQDVNNMVDDGDDGLYGHTMARTFAI